MSKRCSVGHTGSMTNLVHPSQLDQRLQDLQRPQHSGFTGGLCRALAERWRVDPIIVRLGVIALTFAGGVGLVLYAWGCLLTPRTGGQPPILRWLPAFGKWSMGTQGLVVAISSLVLVLSIARQTGVAWGPVIIVAVVAWAAARKRKRASGAEGTVDEYPPPSSVPVPGAAPEHGETVEQWRTRLSAHGGSSLPTVDLYASEPAPLASVPLARADTRTSWWAALAVVALTLVAGAVPTMLNIQPVLLWSCVSATATGALLLLVWSLVARSRRLPGALLVLALAGAAGTGVLAINHSEATTIPLDEASGGTARYSYVGESGTLDLTGLASDTPATVTIDTTASVIEIQLAAPPGSVTVLGDTTHVENYAGRMPIPRSELNIIVDGDFSVVELVVVP